LLKEQKGGGHEGRVERGKKKGSDTFHLKKSTSSHVFRAEPQALKRLHRKRGESEKASPFQGRMVSVGRRAYPRTTMKKRKDLSRETNANGGKRFDSAIQKKGGMLQSWTDPKLVKREKNDKKRSMNRVHVKSKKKGKGSRHHPKKTRKGKNWECS